MRLGDFDYPFKSTGRLHFDPRKGHPKFKPWWCLLECDKGIVEFYQWLLKSYGIDSFKNKLWGPHISIIKGEEPTNNKEDWGKLEGESITFYYTNFINFSNGRHAWIDCVSDDLGRLREHFGIKIAPGFNTYKIKYHMTIGILKKPFHPVRRVIKGTGRDWLYDQNSGIITF